MLYISIVGALSAFSDASFSAVPLGLRKVGRFPLFSRSSES